LKVLIGDNSKCTGCGTCEDVCSQTYFKVKDKTRSAIRITNSDGSNKIEVCDQCASSGSDGDCTKMCNPQAVKRGNNGVVRITKNTCVGCLVCVAECLRGFMHYHDDEPVPFKCIACGLCVKHCPTGALSITE